VHFGLPFTMTSRITELERPVRFVDEQVRGPFRRFRHEHLFEAAGGDTVMIDRITFAAPFWLLGAWWSGRCSARTCAGSSRSGTPS
jgi:ligand-binding SRPBCC domain-containing protein